MDLFAIDDSSHLKPTRDGMGPLVAVGGIHVPGASVRELEHGLDDLCLDYGFPNGEEFKWSPHRKSWMHRSLVGEERTAFLLQALQIAEAADAVAIVVMADSSKRKASGDARTHEEDVTLLFLERAHNQIPEGQHAVVIFDRPGGNSQNNFEFLAACIDALRSGTTYATLDRLALALSTDSRLSRLIQLADVVTACSTAYVAGESRYSPEIFQTGILPLLREDNGCRGGRGMKIHPDFRYGNLYHWLLQDDMFVRYQTGTPLPSKSFHCYRASPDIA